MVTFFRGLLASTGGEDGSGIAATVNGQKKLSRSSLDEHSLLLDSPLLDNSQVRFITNVLKELPAAASLHLA